ncbi:hypothetical protein EJB05_49053 [Eragrostis curvula]|uniref:Uncharacterized protein n=1 Tax=Eragrostis curvula TaxID=38414 RepID=A0A5J9T398_9POAL|nr:hypothetical protein EJB05_49053 [Eragrostis curvula]
MSAPRVLWWFKHSSRSPPERSSLPRCSSLSSSCCSCRACVTGYGLNIGDETEARKMTVATHL